jgi:two-component system response regulator MprA
MLREDGYEVEIANDGASAIGRLTRDPLPDALVTDVRMPAVDGVAVARYARARRPSMLLVFLTSYPELLEPEHEGFQPEAIVHSKPVEYAVLRAQLGGLDPP